MNYLANAFSLQMLSKSRQNVEIEKIEPDQVPGDCYSAIGHEDTARVVSSILGRGVQTNRISIKLRTRDVLYVAQLTGQRLPEGATELPEGAHIQFWKVTVLKPKMTDDE